MSTDILSLSIIQGISEILPISSSVNLHFFSKILRVSSFTFSLKVALHAGSLLTLLIYFRHEICDIFRGLFGKKRISETYLMALILGTIPVVIFGYYARDFVKEFDSPKVMGILSIIFGILLYAFDKFSGVTKSVKAPISCFKSLLIGCCQTIAIFPGVSRLGICITSSRLLGITRKEAINFSLMLAIPSICGSLCLEILDCYKRTAFFTSETISGIAVTALVGLAAILPCIRLMERHGFLLLSAYRVVIGIAICFLG